jgi:hypothetical protein
VLTLEPILLLFALAAPLSLSRILSAYIVFSFTLCSSIIIYRISPWHPLAHIPGPTIHKITKLWGMWVCAGGNQHMVNKALHDKYGPFLRTGTRGFIFLAGRYEFEINPPPQARMKFPLSTSTPSNLSWAPVDIRRVNVCTASFIGRIFASKLCRLRAAGGPSPKDTQSSVSPRRTPRQPTENLESRVEFGVSQGL